MPNTRTKTRTTARSAGSAANKAVAKTAKAVKAANTAPKATARRTSYTASAGPYARSFIYAPIGAGQLLIEKARELPARAMDMAVNPSPRARVMNAYQGLADRGEQLVSSIRRSAATQRATEQAKTARSRVKAAATSVGKAVDMTAEATRTAVQKAV